MGGMGKYSCDYCGKQFKDTASARKRHLLGIQHQRAKALWFDSFKVADGFGPNQFVTTYGDSMPIPIGQPTLGNTQAPVVMGNQLGNMVRDSTGVDLPPSLKPPPEGGYPPLPFIDWG